MTTRNRISLHILAVSMFSLGLLACGMPDTSGQDCKEGPCLEGSSGGPWKKPLCREDADCGWGGEPAANVASASFHNASGATRLFRIHASTGAVVLPEQEVVSLQTVAAPAWRYDPGTSPTIRAEVWTHYGVKLAETSTTLSAMASSVSCVFRYTEQVEGTGGANAVSVSCS